MCLDEPGNLINVESLLIRACRKSPEKIKLVLYMIICDIRVYLDLRCNFFCKTNIHTLLNCEFLA